MSNRQSKEAQKWLLKTGGCLIQVKTRTKLAIVYKYWTAFKSQVTVLCRWPLTWVRQYSSSLFRDKMKSNTVQSKGHSSVAWVMALYSHLLAKYQVTMMSALIKFIIKYFRQWDFPNTAFSCVISMPYKPIYSMDGWKHNRT